MRQFAIAIVVLASAVAASAQFTADSNVHAERADGTEIVLPSQVEPAGGFIVEFVAPPAAANAAAKTAIDYQATFTRFRNDLTTILNARRSGKTAVSGKTAMDAQIRREYSIVFNGVALDAPREVIDQLRMLPYVKRIVADMQMHALADPANITLINAPKVWSSLGSRGSGVTVAIIDTGVNYMHDALGKGFGPGFKVKGGWDFANNDADPLDDNGHGTHVAGIVAGQSDIITGVAPDVSLVAYKVLGANGSGSESNVIAAIERAADPNQDGNTADHVDVANLSLGGTGNPDDPGSIAIDNATAAGITFAIAAGNSGSSFHTIASPGTSRNAITVGASDLTDTITSFSSRGPNMKNMAVKPDVVAPGLSILSSYLGNSYATLSGTSMATPHVAGAAALLKALHHDWTPAQIKLALMNNATLLHDDIMAGGAGRIDVYAAATGPIRIDPPSISLGLDPIDVSNWTTTRSLHVTNSGTQSVTFTVKSNVLLGEKVTPSPATVTVPAGGAADVSLAFAVDNSITIASAASFTGGGQIVFTNAAVPADVHTIQFAFTKAARATVTFDRAYPDAFWVSESRTSVLRASHLDDNTSEILMNAGAWDMLIYTPELDDTTGAITGADFIGREAVAVTKDTTIALTAADIPHTVTLGGRRETGAPLTGNGYASGGRILFGGATGGFTALSFPFSDVHALRVSDLSMAKTLLLYETMLDTTANSYYMIQHPPLVGLTADANLTTGGAALRGGAVQLAMPAASRGDRRLAVNAASTSASVVSLTSIVDVPLINAHVFVSPDVHPNYSYGIAFTAIADGATQYSTPLLRVVNDKLVSLTVAGLLPWTYSGTSYEFGLGPRFPSTVLTPATGTRLNWSTDIIGPLGEVRVGDRTGTINTLFDATGARLSTAAFSTSVDLGAKAAFRLEAVNQGTLYPGVNKTTTVSMNVDSSRTDYIPPSLTTMMLQDGSGTLVTRLEPHGSGSLLFSAADFGILNSTSRVYQQIAADATAVSYRYSGESVWRPLTATQVTEAPAISATGILYRVDLASVANVAGGFVDLKFDLADAAGNTTTVTMAPAFSVGPEVAPRHRAER
ncbi:MAG TPA: S8 family serine peptidase [Thermoanaerobaculia bacterium]|jgi:subtilisin family serine protease|nr:S8 family serine peptidase [Thermoanaerobaculia bacterium]